jgi:hypothetical protein
VCVCVLMCVCVSYMYDLLLKKRNSLPYYSPHLMRKSLRGGGGVGSGAVRGESVLVGGLKGGCWWKTV